MAEVEVAGLGQDQGTDEPMLLLRERGGSRRYLAIWIGAPEATALAAAGSGARTPRPMTHRLLLDVVEALGAGLLRVSVSALVEGQFHAEIRLETAAHGEVVVPARASDAVTLALHVGCPIDAADTVLEEAALPSDAVTSVGGPDSTEPDDPRGPAGPQGGTAPSAGAPVDVEDEIERLRRALAEATPEDFRPEGGSDPEGRPGRD